MRFLIDAQLPPALARWLTASGHEAEHVADVDMAGAPDHTIWRLADRTEAVIVTKDEDFARLRTGAERGPQVVWIRLPNTRRVELLRWFEAALPDIKIALERGERLVEVV